jgi:DNA-directed RNA polymerase
MTLEAESLLIEKEIVDTGINRYRARVAKAVERGTQSFLPSVRYMFREVLEGYIGHIEAYLKQSKFTSNLQLVFDALGADVLAYKSLQVVFDRLLVQNNYSGIAKNIGESLEVELLYPHIHEIMGKAEWATFERRKHRLTAHTTYSFFRRVISEHEYTGYTYLTPKQKSHIGGILLELMVQKTGLFETGFVRRGKRQNHKVLMPTPGCIEWIHDCDDFREALSPAYMPILVPPVNWTATDCGGYHSDSLQGSLLKVHKRAFVREIQDNLGQPVLDAVNALQHTRWAINTDVYETMNYFWESSNPVADLPERENRELPPMLKDPTPDQLRDWKGAAFRVHEWNNISKSHRLRTALLLNLSRKYRGKTFFIPYELDFRGRAYPVPICLQPQGCKQAKGLHKFAEGKAIGTPEAEQWYLIHGANTFGVDKVSFQDRIQWTIDNQEKILAVCEDPVDNRWWADGDSPWEFLAWCLEHGDYIQDGLEHISHIPVGMDGSNNGLQVYSMLLRDQEGAKNTNCCVGSFTEPPEDIYKVVADKASKVLYASDDPGLDFWKEYLNGEPFPRAATKRAVMTRPYNVTKYRAQWYLYEWYMADKLERNNGKYVAKQGEHKACSKMANIIWEALDETIPKAVETMEWLKGIARLFLAENKEIRWDTPCGLRVIQSCYRVKPMTLSFKVNAKQTKLTYTDPRDLKKHKRGYVDGICPNFIHSLDAAAMMLTVNRCNEQGLSDFHMVHDCFGTHAVDAPLLARELRSAYSELFQQDLLEDLRVQFQKQLDTAVPAPPRRGDYDIGELTNSLYFFS